MSICDLDLSRSPNMAETEEARAASPPVQYATLEESNDFFATHVKTFEWRWRLFFEPLPVIPLLPRPISIGVQSCRDARYRCDGRFRFRENFAYFCYTLGGVGGFRYKDTEYRTTAGQGFLVQISDLNMSYYYPPESDETWSYFVCEFAGEAAMSMMNGLVQHYGPIFTLAPDTAILRRLMALAGPPYAIMHPHPVDASELTIELLLALAASGRAQEKNDAAMDLVKRAMQIIGETDGSELNVEELARRVGVSRERLSRVFRARLDRSPHQVILEQKIHDSCILLKDTTMTVKEISAKIGYSDYTNFIRVFRQVMQTTPNQFRRQGSVVRLGRFGLL
ncbi:AraC family transcriptional regulator [Capsulimonas corticalis]|uniref:AraC family transcriptional regulator n=1 Tax=Capsulimonas corticalis TaxID=2219043 RepID=A0A402CQ19_9BACT|nr:AraC family transcriptional regulator [Capsulimonas corticalis]BDI32848.1 AraC family transcriptional regulator [Capsulimonas corticalis]